MHVYNDTKVVHPVSVMTRTLASYVSLFLVSVFFAVITSKLTSSSLSASTPTLQVPNPAAAAAAAAPQVQHEGHRTSMLHYPLQRHKDIGPSPPAEPAGPSLQASFARIVVCLKAADRDMSQGRGKEGSTRAAPACWRPGRPRAAAIARAGYAKGADRGLARFQGAMKAGGERSC